VQHSRMVTASGNVRVFSRIVHVYKPSDCTRLRLPGKHRYALPLDDAMCARLAPLAQPYPKKAEASVVQR